MHLSVRVAAFSLPAPACGGILLPVVAPSLPLVRIYDKKVFPLMNSAPRTLLHSQ